MKEKSIRAYKFAVIAFFIIISILVYFNISYLKQLELIRSNVKPEVTFKPNIIKAYGYSDALEVLSKIPHINISSFNVIEDKKLLKVEIEYDGDIDSFIKTLSDLKKEDNYYNIDNIKLENINTTKQLIRLNLLLVKNK